MNNFERKIIILYIKEFFFSFKSTVKCRNIYITVSFFKK